MSFWSELRRRKVVRAAIAYPVVALAVAEGTDIFLPQLGAPPWVVRVVLALLVLGFPLALVLAWAYEITPEGLVRDTAAPSAPEPPEASSPGAAAASDRRDRRRPADDDRPSVAVLPLLNMSGDPGNDFFSDGVTEDILTHLSCIKSLRVTSRTSVMQYKGTTKTVREIADELGVDSVLEGSIRVARGRVRVSVQLIDADRDDHLWAEAYDRDLEDVFAVQSEVARAVATALQAELSPSEVDQICYLPTENVEAYTLCLRGEEAMSSWVPVDLDRAVEYFETALRLDPDYARPRAGLAMVLGLMPIFTGRTPEGLHERIERAALEALELDAGLAVPHAALAMVRYSRDFDWAGAEAAFQRALTLAPKDPLVLGARVFYLIMQERHAEALSAWEGIEASRRAMILVRGSSAFAAYSSGRPEEAVELAQTGLRDFPDSPTLLYHKGVALGYLERYEEALEALARAAIIDRELALAVAVRTLYLAEIGRSEEMEAEFERLAHWEGSEPVGPFIMGYAHLARGDVEQAIDHWEEAVRRRDLLAPFLRSPPRLRPLRAHPRFQALLQRMWPDHGPFPVEEGP